MLEVTTLGDALRFAGLLLAFSTLLLVAAGGFLWFVARQLGGRDSIPTHPTTARTGRTWLAAGGSLVVILAMTFAFGTFLLVLT